MEITESVAENSAVKVSSSRTSKARRWSEKVPGQTRTLEFTEYKAYFRTNRKSGTKVLEAPPELLRNSRARHSIVNMLAGIQSHEPTLFTDPTAHVVIRRSTKEDGEVKKGEYALFLKLGITRGCAGAEQSAYTERASTNNTEPDGVFAFDPQGRNANALSFWEIGELAWLERRSGLAPLSERQTKRHATLSAKHVRDLSRIRSNV